MSISVEYMREKLRQAPKYRGAAKWIARVNSMHEQQVIAVYFRMLRANAL